MEIVTDT